MFTHVGHCTRPLTTQRPDVCVSLAFIPFLALVKQKMSNTPSFVTQVSKDSTHLQLDQAVRQRRESVSATRARRESMSKAKEETEVPDPAEVKVQHAFSSDR